MKRKKIIIDPPKTKTRHVIPDGFNVKIHDTDKDHRRKKMKLKNIRVEDIDPLDDAFYE